MLRGRSTQLVGREHELAALREAAEQARQGRSQVVLVEGEPGIGKTRLVAELTKDLAARGEIVLTGHGVDLAGGELGFGVAAELLRDLVGQIGAQRLRTELPGHVSALAPLEPALADVRTAAAPTADRTSLFGAFHALALRLSRERLMCVSIDDLQWVDISSLDLIHYLARVCQGRLLSVFTVRSSQREIAAIQRQLADLARLPGSRMVTLRPLDKEQVARLVAQSHPASTDIDSDWIGQVQRLSEGVPLYVEELLSAPQGTLSTALRVNLASRLAGLADDTMTYLQTVAVAEGHAYPRLASQVSGLGAAAAAAAHRDAEERGLLAAGPPQEPVRFHHALLREAVVRTLPRDLEQQLHQRWAEALEAGPHEVAGQALKAVIAVHRSGAGEPNRALVATLQAAEAAHEIGALEEARAQWLNALRLWTVATAPEHRAAMRRDDVLQKAVEATARCTRWPELIAMVEAELATVSVEQADEAWDKRLWLRLIRSLSLNQVGVEHSPVVSSEELDKTIDALLAHRPNVFVLRSLLWLWWQHDDRTDLFDPIHDGIELGAKAIGSPGLLCASLLDRARCAMESGDADSALQLCRRAEALRLTGIDRQLVLANKVTFLVGIGRFSDAVATAERGIAGPSSTASLQALAPQVAENLIYALAASGDWERAWELGGHLLEHSQGYSVAGTTHALMAQLVAQRGDVDLAEMHLSRAWELVPHVGAPVYQHLGITSQPHIAAATLALVRQHADEVRRQLDPVLRDPALARASEVTWEATLIAAQGLELMQDPDVTWREQIASAVRQVHRFGRLGQAWAAEAELRLHHLRASTTATDWYMVVEGWDAVGFAYYSARSRLPLAAALVREGARDLAAEVLDEAHRRAEQLEAQPLAAEIRQLQTRSRLRPTPDRGCLPEQALLRLTPRELQVLQLLAAGQTNEQIASQLFMSPKTASVHTSRIISKLGVANRTEVAVYAHRHGVVS